MEKKFAVQILLSGRIFPIRRKFSDNLGGRSSCPYWVTTCHDATIVVEGYVLTLLPETPGTRVPVRIPDGYPGTKIPESPSTNPQYMEDAVLKHTLSSRLCIRYVTKHVTLNCT